MTNNNDTIASYQVQPFMHKELGLKLRELLIYAVIYAFTKSESGVFFGTQEYLARSTGSSVSTVKRSIASLLKKNYIVAISLGRRRGYKTTETMKPSAVSDADKHDAEIKQVYPALAHREQKDKFDISDCIPQNPPKYEYHAVGRNDIVRMTPEQYKKLLTLVNSEVLFAYMRKLEILIRDQGYRTFSPYQTIKSWINKDSTV